MDSFDDISNVLKYWRLEISMSMHLLLVFIDSKLYCIILYTLYLRKLKIGDSREGEAGQKTMDSFDDISNVLGDIYGSMGYIGFHQELAV